jgi:hypothetical protein
VGVEELEHVVVGKRRGDSAVATHELRREDQNPPYDFAAGARTLFDATGTAEKRLEVFPGALHGTFLVMGSAAVRVLLLDFVRDPATAVP